MIPPTVPDNASWPMIQNYYTGALARMAAWSPLAWAAVFAIALSGSLSAHQIDEYLAITHVEILRERIHIFASLTPGSALAPGVIAAIDSNGDGEFSDAEKQRYAMTMVDSFAVAVDDLRPVPKLIDLTYPAVDELLAGQGIIQMKIAAEIPRLPPGTHSVFVANNARNVTVFVASALLPSEPEISITGQERDMYQRHLSVEYTIAPAAGTRQFLWIAAIGVMLAVRVVVPRYRPLRSV